MPRRPADPMDPLGTGATASPGATTSGPKPSTPDPYDPAGTGATTAPTTAPTTTPGGVGSAPSTTPTAAPPRHGRGAKPVDPVDPIGSTTSGPPPETDIDKLIEENVRRYLMGGQDNTEARNKALADASAAATGRQIVNQRASMGRAGFGASGALAGLEMDARQQAARNLALDQAAVGEDEQKQQYDRFLGATGADIDKQRLAQEQADADARLAFLKSVVGGGGDAPVDEDGNPNSSVGPGYADVKAPEGAPPLSDEDRTHAHTSRLVNSVPEGATKFAEDAKYTYYEYGDPPRYVRVTNSTAYQHGD